jgi:2-polyprenyl-3-methyl-5-hydroxy-6-metoxy-1,4-benzoquinol methylase
LKLYSKLLEIGKGEKKIEWISRLTKGYSVLDLGCIDEKKDAFEGANWLHKHLKKDAALCIGIDSNEKEVNRLQSLGYQINFGDVQNFDLNRKFDVVVAADILEHLDDFKGFFKSVRNALKDDGRLVITTPNPWFFLKLIRCLFKGDPGCNPNHVVWFCQQTLKKLLELNGFVIETIEYGSSEPIFYRIGRFRKILFHTSIFCIAKKSAAANIAT